MKILTLIARLLLGLTFVVFGLNGFLNFLSMGPMPTGLAGQFIGALFLSHYFRVVAGLQLVGGLLLLVNRFVPLAFAAWPSNRKHPSVSPVPVSSRYRSGYSRNHPVVYCLLRASPILLRGICSKNVMNDGV